LIYSTSAPFIVSRGTAAVTGIFRRMQATFVINLPCSGTRKKGHFILYVKNSHWSF